MKNGIVIFLLMISTIYAQYSITNFNLNISNIGKIGALTYFNLKLDGDADLDYFSLDFYEKCLVNNTFMINPSSKYSLPYSISQMRIDYTIYQNKTIILSPAYHLEYYYSLNNTLNYPTTNITYLGDPYNYKILNNSRNQECSAGISLISKRNGAVSLYSLVTIIYGFILKFDVISVNLQNYCPFKKYSNCEKNAFTLDIVIHNIDINSVFNGFNSNSYTFLSNSIIISVNCNYTDDNTNYYIIKLIYINQSGKIIGLGNTKIYLVNPFFNSYQVSYITNSGDMECIRYKVLFFNSQFNSASNLIKLYINGNLVLCSYVDLKSLINSYQLMSPDPLNNNIINGALNGKGHISLIGSATMNNNQLLLLPSMSFNSNSSCFNNNLTIICGGKSKFISLSNISINDKGEIIKVYYRNKNWRFNHYEVCSPGNHEIKPGIDNPFWEKCSAIVYYSDNIEDLVVINNLGIRLSLKNFYNLSVQIGFQPNDMFNVCVNSEYSILQAGFCDCRLCEKLLNFGKAFYYSLVLCKKTFSSECRCFDISNTNDIGNNTTFITINICSECKFDSHCSLALYNAKCSSLQTNVVMGNPLFKNISNLNTTQTFSLDFGRVLDGTIKGENCDCESNRNNTYFSANNNSFTYNIYSNKAINNINEWSLCVDCLQNKQKTESECQTNYCGNGETIYYYSRPVGYNCLSCLYSGEIFQSLAVPIQNIVIKCVENAKKAGQNIFTFCSNLSTQINYELSQIFIGILSHFLVECPGKIISLNGAVCIPYFNFNNYSFNRIVFKKTFSNEEWDLNNQCINSDCEPSSKANCFGKSCVCYDTCPLGKLGFPNQAKFFQVPCSGNGVCSLSGCLCNFGYLLPNCETHCSDTVGGCCLSDSECAGNVLDYKKCTQISNNIGFCSTA